MDLVPGWITLEEMNLVKKYMTNNYGKILEIGSASGRLIAYLYKFFPLWDYVAVDAWKQEETYLQKDWNKLYFDSEKGQRVTKEMFINNCPFARAYEAYFEKFNIDEKFNIISIGLNKRNLDWELIYNKAAGMLINDGYLIGRNLYHYREGLAIQHAVKNYNILEIVNGSFVIKVNR